MKNQPIQKIISLLHNDSTLKSQAWKKIDLRVTVEALLNRNKVVYHFKPSLLGKLCDTITKIWVKNWKQLLKEAQHLKCLAGFRSLRPKTKIKPTKKKNQKKMLLLEISDRPRPTLKEVVLFCSQNQISPKLEAQRKACSQLVGNGHLNDKSRNEDRILLRADSRKKINLHQEDQIQILRGDGFLFQNQGDYEKMSQFINRGLSNNFRSFSNHPFDVGQDIYNKETVVEEKLTFEENEETKEERRKIQRMLLEKSQIRSSASPPMNFYRSQFYTTKTKPKKVQRKFRRENLGYFNQYDKAHRNMIRNAVIDENINLPMKKQDDVLKYGNSDLSVEELDETMKNCIDFSKQYPNYNWEAWMNPDNPILIEEFMAGMHNIASQIRLAVKMSQKINQELPNTPQLSQQLIEQHNDQFDQPKSEEPHFDVPIPSQPPSQVNSQQTINKKELDFVDIQWMKIKKLMGKFDSSQQQSKMINFNEYCKNNKIDKKSAYLLCHKIVMDDDCKVHKKDNVDDFDLYISNAKKQEADES